MCGRELTGRFYFVHGQPDRYCETCITTRPRCDSCAAPVGAQHWRLHDGRIQCGRCHRTAVYDPAEARALFDETVRSVAAQLGLVLHQGVEFRLVDAPDMARARSLGAPLNPAEQTMGLYQQQGPIRAIYMLYGIPRITFRMVVAHEYGHAWQGEHCQILENETLREGFCEWVAYRHLLYLGCHKAAQQMLTSNHPYRPMLEYVLALEQRVGPRGVIAHMKTAGLG